MNKIGKLWHFSMVFSRSNFMIFFKTFSITYNNSKLSNPIEKTIQHSLSVFGLKNWTWTNCQVNILTFKMRNLDSPRNSFTQTDDNVQNLISSARSAVQDGNFERAEEDLYLGLALIEKVKNPTQLPFIYDILSAIAFAKGDLEKAASILDKALDKMTTLGYPYYERHVTDFRFRLARIFSSFSKSDKVENNFKQSLKALTNENSEHTRLVYANFLFRYALYKIRILEYDEAKKIINQALEHFKIDKSTQQCLLKFISSTLSELRAGIRACGNLEDTLPLLKLPEIRITKEKGVQK